MLGMFINIAMYVNMTAQCTQWREALEVGDREGDFGQLVVVMVMVGKFLKFFQPCNLCEYDSSLIST